MEHSTIRETFKWGTCGKHHNEPLRYILLKDISDAHLSKIIPWIEKYMCQYDMKTLNVFKTEARFRVDNYIFVPDYDIVAPKYVDFNEIIISYRRTFY
jgi:hypothetical protein